jgi:transcriptional regulator of acetoin/glycerol metabolism
VITCPGDILEVGHLPERLMNARHEDATIPIRIGMSIQDVEKELIVRTMEYTGHNRTRTSQILGISRRSLYNKIQRYNLFQ